MNLAGAGAASVRIVPSEIVVQPAAGLLEYRQHRLFVLGVERRGEIFLPFEPESCQAFAVGSRCDRAER